MARYQTEIADVSVDFEGTLDRAAALLRRGELVAFPTETVYGLGADARNGDAVSAVYAAKGRPSDNPMIVHVASGEEAAAIAEWTPEADALMKAFWPGALTLVLPSRGVVAAEATGGLDTVGVRMPDHPIALALIARSSCAVAAPSANRSGQPSPTTAQHVYDDLNGRIPLILDGGATSVGVESTVLSLAGERPTILRPGSITPEQIERVIGGVELSPGALAPLESGEKVLSPGMKYRHYAPTAEVMLIDGRDDEVVQAICAYYDQLAGDKKVIIFTSRENARFYADRKYAIMGGKGDMEEYCRQLYAQLRRADDEGIEIILIEAVPSVSAGLAFMNRALRAAEFRLIAARTLLAK